MNKLVQCILFLAFISSAQTHAQLKSDLVSYQVLELDLKTGEVLSSVLTDEIPPIIIGEPKDSTGTMPGPTLPVPPPSGGTSSDPFVEIDKLINLGKEIWKIIDAGKPVYNEKVDFASALPKGVTHFTELEEWKLLPTMKRYRVEFSNRAGGKPIQFEYVAVVYFGGKYNGKGAYILRAGFEDIVPSIAYGYRLNLEAQAPAVYNVGTKENPIAAVNIGLKWSANLFGIGNEANGAISFIMTGNGDIIDKSKLP